MNCELAPCRVNIVGNLGAANVASRWTATGGGLEIALAASGRGEHDIALELLLCLGQALWERLPPARRAAYWMQLDHGERLGEPRMLARRALRRRQHVDDLGRHSG